MVQEIYPDFFPKVNCTRGGRFGGGGGGGGAQLEQRKKKINYKKN
jgi:hypothetical protein